MLTPRIWARTRRVLQWGDCWWSQDGGGGKGGSERKCAAMIRWLDWDLFVFGACGCVGRQTVVREANTTSPSLKLLTTAWTLLTRPAGRNRGYVRLYVRCSGGAKVGIWVFKLRSESTLPPCALT